MPALVVFFAGDATAVAGKKKLAKKKNAQPGQVCADSAQTGDQAAFLRLRLVRGKIRQVTDGFGAGGYSVTLTGPPATAREIGSGDIQLASIHNGPELVIRAQDGYLMDGGWDGWVSGYGVGGNVDGTAATAGFDYTSGGTQIGLYRLLDPCTLVGLFGGYGHQYVGVDVADSQTVSINNYSLGAFLRRAHCSYRYDGYTVVAGSVAYDDYGSRRDTATGIADGDYDGGQTSVFAEHGLERQIGCYIVEPSAALQYTWLHQNGFTETGAGANNLTVDDADTHSLRTILGTRIMTTRCTCLGELEPEFRAQWMHELLDATTGITATSGGTTFVSPSAGLGRDFAILGGGLTLRRNVCLAVTVNYDLQFNDRTQFHIGYGGVEFSY